VVVQTDCMLCTWRSIRTMFQVIQMYLSKTIPVSEVKQPWCVKNVQCLCVVTLKAPYQNTQFPPSLLYTCR
jgi:hypothetical protein